MKKSQKALGDYSNIEYVYAGASDKRAVLHLKKDGSASRIADDGELSIKVDKIDNVISTPISFIKMDIEGSEVAAIKGAKNTILQNHPKLAICVYHKGDDFISIPQAVFDIRTDYNLYLRHYTGNFRDGHVFSPSRTRVASKQKIALRV